MIRLISAPGFCARLDPRLVIPPLSAESHVNKIKTSNAAETIPSPARNIFPTEKVLATAPAELTRYGVATERRPARKPPIQGAIGSM